MSFMRMQSPQSISRRTPTQGFTLLEVLVAATIMVIISIMLIGGTSAMMANQKFTSSTDRVISTLHLARNLAITHNAIYHVRIQNFDIVNGKDNYQQAIGIYCFPRANDALSTQNVNRLTGEPDNVDPAVNPEMGWSPYNTLTPDIRPPQPAPPFLYRNYRVAYVPLEKDTFVGIQAAPTALAPDTSILYFMPDGSASVSQTLFVANDILLRDNPRESTWVWKDRNDIRRAVHNGSLAGYTPPPAPTDEPLATSSKDKIRPQTSLNVIQVYQGGMIRFLKQERL
jgi:prepilin-type N-terminal cleavage/methylation domain-containing protein